jgi:hypothetical protein
VTTAAARAVFEQDDGPLSGNVTLLYVAAVRWIVVLLLAWSGVVLIGLLLVGPDLSAATGCLRIAGGPVECLEQLTAVDDQRWRLQTLPRLVVGVAGYVLIDVYGIWALRTRPRQSAW